MVYIVLCLVGAVLVVNGLTMAQVVTAFSPVAGDAAVPVLGLAYSANGIATINLIIGVIIGVIALIIATKGMLDAFGETVSPTVGATVLGFSVAYLVLGFSILTMYNGAYAALAAAAVPAGKQANGLVSFAALQPLGWYCFPMSIYFFVVGLGFYNVLGKKLPKVTQFGHFWILWSITFFLFFYVLGLGNYGDGLSLLKFTGWWTLFVGIVTCVVPALGFFNSGKIGAW